MRQTVMTTAISGTAENIVIQGSNFVCTQVGGNSNTLTCYLLNAEGVPTGSTSSIVVAAQAPRRPRDCIRWAPTTRNCLQRVMSEPDDGA